jgi:hypothetical protein
MKLIIAKIIVFGTLGLLALFYVCMLIYMTLRNPILSAVMVSGALVLSWAVFTVSDKL